MVQALLLQPPPGDLTGPYPALPYIKILKRLKAEGKRRQRRARTN
jgi:hypothetical protein